MKKILSAALALSVMTGLLAFSASADAPALVSAEDIAVMSVEQIAYLDLDTAAPAVQDAILEARNEIIHGEQSWTVDGAVSVFDVKTGVVTQLPEFSDLYPGWDIPEVEVPFWCEVAEMVSGTVRSSEWKKHFDKDLTLGSPTTPTETFYDFPGRDSEVGAYATNGPRDARYNLGLQNNSTKEEIGWVYGLQLNEGIKTYTSSDEFYGVRASVSDSQSIGRYRLYVTDDPDIIGSFHEAG